MRGITVKRLREMLAELDEEALLVVEGHDHNYRVADVHVTTALKVDGRLEEDWHTGLVGAEKRIQVLLIC